MHNKYLFQREQNHSQNLLPFSAARKRKGPTKPLMVQLSYSAYLKRSYYVSRETAGIHIVI